MKSDIEIASSVKLRPIGEVAAHLGIGSQDLEQYGNHKAKVKAKLEGKAGKLILVTAINPTAAGEGKTTVSIGLADGLKKCGRKVALALREPSLGPVFGIKGGAAGGGYAQIAPMADINLHFTGDIHAATSANNLLSAMIDNHIHFDNPLKIKRVVWRRCMDMNDRALRYITVGQGGPSGCVPRQESFSITAASEIMSILCLARDMEDLKYRLGEIVVGIDQDGRMVKARELKAEEAMAILLKDAIEPNLVQTLEGTPAFVHGGPFANIAHGCNSVRATLTAMHYADYTVTEAGFGADLGAEKFLNIKCRVSGIAPSCVVIVATVRALKSGGGVPKEQLSAPNADAVKKGLPNLIKHIANIKDGFKLPCVVAINKFATDTQEEIDTIFDCCRGLGVDAEICNAWAQGGEGAVDLAQKVADICNGGIPKINFTYNLTDGIAEKINKIATNIYGADGADFSEEAISNIAEIEAAGYKDLPVCIAKTQYSLSDDPALLGAPEGFRIKIREVLIRGGARFIVAVAGSIMLMPGLPRVPNAERMTISKDNDILGLF